MCVCVYTCVFVYKCICIGICIRIEKIYIEIQYVQVYSCIYTQNVCIYRKVYIYMGFPGGSDGQEFACQCRRHMISGSARSSGEGNGNPCQYSCLEKSMGRRSWQVTVHRVTKIIERCLHTERFFSSKRCTSTQI